MNVSKTLAAAIAATTIVGAVGLAYAQTTNNRRIRRRPSSPPTPDASGSRTRRREPAVEGSHGTQSSAAPSAADNSSTADPGHADPTQPATTDSSMANEPAARLTATDPIRPAARANTPSCSPVDAETTDRASRPCLQARRRGRGRAQARRAARCRRAGADLAARGRGHACTPGTGALRVQAAATPGLSADFRSSGLRRRPLRGRLGHRLAGQPAPALRDPRQARGDGLRVRRQRPPRRREPRAAGLRAPATTRWPASASGRSSTCGPKNAPRRPAASSAEPGRNAPAKTWCGSTTTPRSRCTVCAWSTRTSAASSGWPRRPVARPHLLRLHQRAGGASSSR